MLVVKNNKSGKRKRLTRKNRGRVIHKYKKILCRGNRIIRKELKIIAKQPKKEEKDPLWYRIAMMYVNFDPNATIIIENFIIMFAHLAVFFFFWHLLDFLVDFRINLENVVHAIHKEELIERRLPRMKSQEEKLIIYCVHLGFAITLSFVPYWKINYSKFSYYKESEIKEMIGHLIYIVYIIFFALSSNFRLAISQIKT